jgi:hypothetical protein
MKKSIVIIALLLMIGVTHAQETATIYVAKHKIYAGVSSPIFIDGKLVCEVGLDSYNVLNIAPGKHSFAVRISGKDTNEKTDKDAIEVEIKAGETYYFKVNQVKTLVSNKLFLEEITHSTWEQFKDKIKQGDCK